LQSFASSFCFCTHPLEPANRHPLPSPATATAWTAPISERVRRVTAQDTHTPAAACLDAFAIASRHHESRHLRSAAAANGHPPAERPATSHGSPNHPTASTNPPANDDARPPRPQRRPLSPPRRDACAAEPLRSPPPARWPQHGMRIHWWRLAASRDMWCRVALRDGRGQQRRGVLSQWPGDMYRRHLYRLCGWQQRAAERCEPLRVHLPGRQRVLPKLF